MLASHWALWTSTGRAEMSVFQMLSAGNMGQFAAPGTGVPASAGVWSSATVIAPTRTRAVASSTTARTRDRRDRRPSRRLTLRMPM